jgi:large subunit ribosomal protein L22
MATSTVERRTVRSQVRYVRVSPYKIREVLGLIRGRAVREAQEALALTERDPATVVAKCLASAVANAAHNDQIEESELFVVECYCDEGPTLKRWRPRARGRATRIRKRTSHVTVILGRYTPDELQIIEDREASKGTGGRRRDAGEDRRRRVAKSRGEEVAEIEDESDTADEGDAAEEEIGDEGIGADHGERPTAQALVDDNTKDELLALAEQAGIEVAKSANKTTIAEAIVAGTDSADEGDA